MTENEWMTRYKQRFIEIAGVSETQAEALGEAESFAVLSDMFEDDPEGAADSEMSYWDAE